MQPGTRKREHIAPIVSSFHQLSVSFRVGFKILDITFKAWNGLAPSYISDLKTPHVLSWALRSLNAALLVVPKW